MYRLMLELLKIPQSVLEDPDALTNYIESNMSEYLGSMTIIMFLGFFIFILALAYLVSLILLNSSFTKLANIDPKIGQVVKVTNISILIGIILPVLGSLVLFIEPMFTMYITLFMYLGSVVAIAVGYFFISRTFTILHALGLFPKRGNRLLFYGQIVLTLTIFPLSISPTTNPLVSIIIAGVIVLGGLTIVIVGFFRLSKDALLIKEIPVSATSVIQVETGFKEPTYQPSTVYTSPQTQEPSSVTENLNEPGVGFCYNCGAKQFTKTQFCKNCGVKFDE